MAVPLNPRWREKLLRMIGIIIVIYLVALAAVFFAQRRLLYFPTRTSEQLSLATAAREGLKPWRDPAERLIGWRQPAQIGTPHHLVLIAHGNAGSALDRVDYARALQQVGNFEVFILEYPGYGPRPGSPTGQSLFSAAEEAIALLEKSGPVYVLGESLGTGVAAHVAGTHPQSVAGLLLVAPYHNLGDVAQHQMRLFPAKWMLRDKFSSAQYLRNFHGPVAVLLGDADTVVPKRFGRQLFDSYAGPKKVWEIPSAGHNDLPNQPVEWWKELLRFWRVSPYQAGLAKQSKTGAYRRMRPSPSA